MKKDRWKNKNVFVTGCTGFLGGWLTQEIMKRGANVIGLIRDSVPRSNLCMSGVVDRINVVRGELEDYFLIERVMNEYEIDCVFHVAAQTIVGISNRSPISTFKSNIEGTWNVLEAARRTKTVKSVIAASSDKAYGEQSRLPYREDSPLSGYYPYDASKTCADILGTTYFKTYSLPVCVVRCGNFYGGGDLNFNRIVPGTVRDILDNKRPVVRSDGKYIRDYIYIKDAVDAYILLAEKMQTKKLYGEAFNFSYGRPISVLELVAIIARIMGKKNLRPIVLDEVRNEITKQYLSSTKARKVLGWVPKYSLEEGLRETVDWYREFFQKQP